MCAKPAIAQLVKKYYFTHYTTESGLASPECNTVVQDADGFIWTGTVNGLQRFDGTRFKTFLHQAGDPGSIPSNVILQLLIDPKKNLWVLTAEGRVGIFNTRDFRFHDAAVKVRRPQSLRSSIKELKLDEYGNLFLVLRGNEIVTWNEKKNEFSWEHNFFSTPPATGLTDIVQIPGTRQYIISLQNGGVAVYNHENRQLNYEEHNPDGNPIVEALAGITGAYNFHYDKKGRCWFQVWQGGFPELYCYDGTKGTGNTRKFEFITTLKTYYETYRYFEQADGSIWVTGLNVFARYLEKENKFEFVYNGYLNERSIAYERVTSLTEDREKNIWVSTSNNGLYRFNPAEQYFTNIPHTFRVTGNTGQGSVLSFIQTRWGTLLTGTWGDGIYQYDRNSNLVPTNISGIDNRQGPTAWCMTASADSNTIWVASQPGLYAISQGSRSSRFFNPSALDNRTIRQVAEDRLGHLWLGMNNFGLFKWEMADKKAYRQDGIHRYEKIPSVMINKLMVDRRGLLWIGTAANGLYVVDPSTDSLVYHFSDKARGAFRLPEEGISSVLDYDDSSIVITTARYVLLFNTKSGSTEPIGKPEFIQGFIASMEKDKKGLVWVSGTNGIYRVNIQKKVFVRFDRTDGIDNDRFILASSYAMPDGRLVFGSSNQFILFDPAAITVTTVNPQPRITEFKVMNKSLQVDSLLRLQQVTLRHNNNSLEIEFSPLVYSSGFMIRYMMEGLDKEWKMAGKENQAIYSYLPPGKYKFMLQTLDAEGKINDVFFSVNIRVNPPFWKSWWFFSLLAIAIGSLLFWLDRERMQRKEAIERMRSTIADNLHSEVNTALNNINILSEMARLKADKDPEKSKEYIEQIHTKSHNMIIAMDDMLWSLDPGNDSMEKTTSRMREYIEALRNRHGVNIDIAVDKKVETLELNMKLRHEAFLVFKEGIKNLVMLGAANCHVYIRSEKNNLLFTTLFESDKCDMQQLNNLLHRQDLEKRLEQMRATIDVDLHKSHSAITLRVPVV